MSPATRALIGRFRRKASSLSPSVRQAWLKGFARLERELTDADLLRLLSTGNVDQLLARVANPEAVARAFTDLRQQLRAGVADAATLFQKDLPKVARPGIAFDVLNPETIEAIRTLESRVLVSLSEDVRATVRQAVEAGLAEGIGPRELARRLRDVLALAPNQEQAVRTFRDLLASGDAEALTRALRDHRFDATVKRALQGDGLTDQQVEAMTAAYRRRMVAFNAETHARTATLDALKEGQRLSWEQAADRGLIDRGRLRKEWVTVGDDRVRPEHEAMNGETVPFDAAFSNGDTVPGESDWNCRCVARYFVGQAA
jgi:hypothetical protein